MNPWVVVPARGGSVGIPRKNLRILAGRPLITYVISAALEVLPASQIVAITDDVEIARVAEGTGIQVVLEQSLTPPDETLDQKLVRNVSTLRELGAQLEDVIITLQPTSPLIKAKSIRAAIDRFRDAPGTKSVLSVSDDRHLRWVLNGDGRPTPAFSARVNRQQLPMEFRETGGIIAARLGDIAAGGTRVIQPVELLTVGDDEAVDIDTYSDLYAAAHLLSRKRIALRVDASKRLGMGHVYRVLALASELARHELKIYTLESLPLGREFFSRYPYETQPIADHDGFCAQLAAFKPDLVVLDILNTTDAEIAAIRRAVPGIRIVSFEDLGSGAPHVDLLVTEFVHNPEVAAHRKLEGIEYSLLAPAFEIARDLSAPSETVENVLILFGGTDPSNLAPRAVESLARAGFRGTVTVVRGLGAAPLSLASSDLPFQVKVLQNVEDMARLMAQAHLAFTSAGRTVVELIAQGVPSICMAQNEKELSHTHAKGENGVLMLGLGTGVSTRELDAATTVMLFNSKTRHELMLRARKVGAHRTNKKTIAAILQRIGFEDFPEI